MPKTCKYDSCNYNVFSGGYCKIHQYKNRKHEYKSIGNTKTNKQSKTDQTTSNYLRSNLRKPISSQRKPKKIQYRRKRDGQTEIFKEIWEERPHICQVTGVYLGDVAEAIFFSHVIPKSICNKLRLDKRNIWLVHPDVHHKWEFGDKRLPMFEEKLAVYNELRKECC